jgi:membrane-associated phospholipid phosphatase
MISSSMRARFVWIWLGAACVPQFAPAQTPMPHDSVHAAKTLFTSRDALLAAGFVGLTVAMLPIDKSVAGRLQNPNAQANQFFKNASTDVRMLGDPGTTIIAVSMYGVGRIARWKNVADFGLHGAEAIAVAGATTTLLKGFAGRARPFVSTDTNPTDFHFGRGFSKGNYQSFPSGHTTAAFALASTVTSESQRWWPHQTWIVGPVTYGAATLVGLSRMYNNAHWASDVALGAAIGTFGGIKIVRYNHGHSGNFIDRFFLGTLVQAGPSGDARVGVSLEY